MGYRSDVRIRLLEKDYKRLVEKFREDIVEGLRLPDLFSITELAVCRKSVQEIVGKINYTDYIKEEPTILFGWDCVKWYEGTFEDVDFIMTFLRDSDIPYAYARIGEEYDDVEKESRHMYDILTVTTFSREAYEGEDYVGEV